MKIIIKDFERKKYKNSKQIQGTINNFLKQKKIEKEDIISIKITVEYYTIIVKDNK